MTTKYSPLSQLKKQADKIAESLKKAERGELINPMFQAKIDAARNRPSFKFAVIMDGSTLQIDMPWETIKSTTETGLSEYILKQMRESRDTLN